MAFDGNSRRGKELIGTNKICSYFFNPTTKINFELPNSGFITLSIFDISGREFKQLVNETKPAGYYSVVFDAKGLSSGE